MSPHAVVIAGIGFKDTAKVSFAEHNNMIEAFPADGTDQPLRMSVLPGRSRRGRAIANAHCLQPPTHGIAIGRIAVSDQVTRRFIPREGVSNLSGDPRRCRMIGALLQKWPQRVAANMRGWAHASSRSDTRSETGPSITGRWSVEGS